MVDFFLSIDKLNLSVRAANGLRSENINTVSDLLKMSQDDLRRIRNIGQQSVDQIESALADFGLELRPETSDPNMPGTRNAGQEFNEFLSGFNAILSSGIESPQMLLEKSDNEILSITGCDREQLEVVKRGLGKWGLKAGMLKKLTSALTQFKRDHVDAKHELLDYIENLLSGARPNLRSCFVGYYGLTGGAVLTLRSIAEEAVDYGFDQPVTRERVRQIIENATKRLSAKAGLLEFRKWREAVRLATKKLPMAAEDFLDCFGYSAGSNAAARFDALKSVAKVLGLPYPFEMVPAFNGTIIMREDDIGTRRTINILNRMPVDTYLTAKDLSELIKCNRGLLRKLVLAHKRWEFLDQNERYVWKIPRLPPKNYRLAGNAILSCLCNVFSVAERASVDDLLQSVPRFRTVRSTVPEEVLTGIASKSGLFDIADGMILRKEGQKWDSMNVRDIDLLRVCVRKGRTVSSTELYAELVQGGLTVENAHITVAYSAFLIHEKSGKGHDPGLYRFIFGPEDVSRIETMDRFRENESAALNS